MSRFVFLFLFIGLSSCSSNWQHAYDVLVPNFDRMRLDSVLVIAVDERPHVIADPESRNLVGQLKGIGTDKRPIFTTRNATFAAQAGQSICNGFLAQQVDCNYFETSNIPQGDSILKFAKQYNAQRILLVEIEHWYVSVFALPTLQYKLMARVYSNLGEYLAGHSFNGSETLRVVEFTNPAQNASITAPEAFSRIMANIVNSDQIIRSLQVQAY